MACWILVYAPGYHVLVSTSTVCCRIHWWIWVRGVDWYIREYRCCRDQGICQFLTLLEHSIFLQDQSSVLQRKDLFALVLLSQIKVFPQVQNLISFRTIDLDCFLNWSFRASGKSRNFILFSIASCLLNFAHIWFLISILCSKRFSNFF